MTAEDVGEDMCPVLVGYDNDLHGICALVVDPKVPQNQQCNGLRRHLMCQDVQEPLLHCDPTRKRQLWH